MKLLLILLTSVLLSACSSTSVQSSQERELASFFRNDPKQQRSEMIYDRRIAQVARAKANDMAQRGYFAHVDPDGNGANFLISKTGYRLPANYLPPRSANYVESLAGGHDTAEETYRQFLTSASHRRHLLAEHPVYTAQTRIGVGYANVPGSKVVHYWVVMTAPPSGTK